MALIDPRQNIQLLPSFNFTYTAFLCNHREKAGSILQPEEFEIQRSPHLVEIVGQNFLSFLPSQEGSIWNESDTEGWSK